MDRTMQISYGQRVRTDDMGWNHFTQGQTSIGDDVAIAVTGQVGQAVLIVLLFSLPFRFHSRIVSNTAIPEVHNLECTFCLPTEISDGIHKFAYGINVRIIWRMKWESKNIDRPADNARTWCLAAMQRMILSNVFFVNEFSKWMMHLIWAHSIKSFLFAFEICWWIALYFPKKW